MKLCWKMTLYIQFYLETHHDGKVMSQEDMMTHYLTYYQHLKIWKYRDGFQNVAEAQWMTLSDYSKSRQLVKVNIGEEKTFRNVHIKRCWEDDKDDYSRTWKRQEKLEEPQKNEIMNIVENSKWYFKRKDKIKLWNAAQNFIIYRE